jgi:hypothetical protein
MMVRMWVGHYVAGLMGGSHPASYFPDHSHFLDINNHILTSKYSLLFTYHPYGYSCDTKYYTSIAAILCNNASVPSRLLDLAKGTLNLSRKVTWAVARCRTHLKMRKATT